MNAIKKHFSGIVLSILEIIVGILLLMNPIGFIKVIILAAGIFMVGFGLISVIRYFRKSPEEASKGQFLLKGMISLGVAVFCLTQSALIVTWFDMLTLIFGIGVVILGLSKIQLTVDMLRVKNRKWFMALISAAVSIACGLIIMNNPFGNGNVLWLFTGITLIVEAVFDVITIIVSNLKKKEAPAAKDSDEKAEEEEPSEKEEQEEEA